MKYLIIIVSLLTGCSSITFENYKDVRSRLKKGIPITQKINIKNKGKYIYLQKANSSAKYGYDYKKGYIRIEFKTEF